MATQLAFKFKSWGGKRRGAGRPNRTKTVSHGARESITWRTPLHVTLKLCSGLPTLRHKPLLRELKRSSIQALKFQFRVVHFSMQSNHLHLIIEAKSNSALALGMRSLAGRFGKIVRRHAHRLGAKQKGRVFLGRYHLRVIRSSRQMRNTLEYVLLNKAKHSKLVEHLDPFSSGRFFNDWRALLKARFRSLIQEECASIPTEQLVPFGQPRSWLCRVGWTKAS